MGQLYYRQRRSSSLNYYSWCSVTTYLLGILILLEANRQEQESRVVHDEVLESIRGASDPLVNIDEMSEEEVDALEERLRARARWGAADP
jgi:low affinity iron permease